MDNQTLLEIYNNISLLLDKNMFYLSPTLASVIDITMWVTFGLSNLVFIILIFLVVKKSPKEMKVYKWYIYCNTAAIYMFELFVHGFMHLSLPVLTLSICKYTRSNTKVKKDC